MLLSKFVCSRRLPSNGGARSNFAQSREGAKNRLPVILLRLGAFSSSNVVIEMLSRKGAIAQRTDGRNNFNAVVAIALYLLAIAALLFASQVALAQPSISSEPALLASLIEENEPVLSLDNADPPSGVFISEATAPCASSTGTSSETLAPCNNGVSELFEISTRHLPDRFRSIRWDNPCFEVNRCAGNRWVRSSIDEALPVEGTGMLTILYVHGNFMERNNALNRLRIIDSFLRQQADRPYRLLMLSWPSQKEGKPLRDVIPNSESAECQSLYVAWILRRLCHEPHVSLLGFSFGARSVTGGLHLSAGGTIPGLVAVPTMPEEMIPSYRVGLVAPAMDRNWLSCNGRHGLALTHVDAMVNLYNSRDPILRRFHFIDRFTRPIAAGFAGFGGLANPRVTTPLASHSGIRQLDCGSIIGTTHSERSYYGECHYFQTVMIKHLLWKDAGDIKSDACVFP